MSINRKTVVPHAKFPVFRLIYEPKMKYRRISERYILYIIIIIKL